MTKEEANLCKFGQKFEENEKKHKANCIKMGTRQSYIKIRI